jgi:hypothetical protein
VTALEFTGIREAVADNRVEMMREYGRNEGDEDGLGQETHKGGVEIQDDMAST